MRNKLVKLGLATLVGLTSCVTTYTFESPKAEQDLQKATEIMEEDSGYMLREADRHWPKGYIDEREAENMLTAAQKVSEGY